MPFRSWLFCVAICCVSFCVTRADGYAHYWDFRDDHLSVAKWRQPFPIPYRLGLIGTDDIAGNREWEIIHEAFEVWQNCPGAVVSFAYAGTTAATDTIYDGQNSVIFVNDLGQGVLGATTITAVVTLEDGSPVLEIVDVDIRINDTPMIQFLDGPWESWTRVSLKGVVVHEIGHLLGLHHSMARESTMWWLSRADQDTLDSDDIAGLAALYPAPSHAVETASIEGRVQVRRLDDSLEPLFGGNVLAVDARTGKAHAADITRGLDPAQEGRYLISGLAPGRYAIYCERVRSGFLVGGPMVEPGGGWSTYYAAMTPPLFTPRCYGQTASDVLSGILVSVEAGQTLSGIDIEVAEDSSDLLEAPPGNDTPEHAVEIGDGSAIASLLHNAGDVDYFKFRIEEAAAVYLAVECNQSRYTDDVMESEYEPDLLLTLLAEDGETVLMESDDYWFTDPFLHFFARRPALYYVRLEDKSGRTVFNVDYLLCLSTGPRGPSRILLPEWDVYE